MKSNQEIANEEKINILEERFLELVELKNENYQMSKEEEEELNDVIEKLTSVYGGIEADEYIEVLAY